MQRETAMAERIVLSPDDAAEIARVLDEHGWDIVAGGAQRIAVDLVAEKLQTSAAFGRDVVIVLDLPDS